MRNKEVDDKFLLIQHSIIREKSIAQLTTKEINLSEMSVGELNE